MDYKPTIWPDVLLKTVLPHLMWHQPVTLPQVKCRKPKKVSIDGYSISDKTVVQSPFWLSSGRVGGRHPIKFLGGCSLVTRLWSTDGVGVLLLPRPLLSRATTAQPRRPSSYATARRTERPTLRSNTDFKWPEISFLRKSEDKFLRENVLMTALKS